MRFEFNARAFPPSQGREKWPDNWYKLIVNAHDIKPTPKGGSRISMTVLCIDGPMNGKENEMGFNIQNENQTTMQIAYEQLSALCYVTGKFNIADLGELHNIPFFAYAVASEQGNNWRAFKDVNGNDAINLAKQAGGITTRAGAGQAQQQQPAQVPQQVQQQQQPAGVQAQPPGAWVAPGGGAGPAPGGAPAWAAPGGQQQPAQQQWQPPAQQQQQPPAQQQQQPPAGQQQWQAPGGGAPAATGWTPPGQGQPAAAAPAWATR